MIRKLKLAPYLYITRFIMKRSASSSSSEKSSKVAKIENTDKFKLSWKHHGEPVKGISPLLYLDGPSIAPSKKIASFDMDGTLIKTKSGKTFATDKLDWVFLNGKVINKLNSLHEDGYKVIIFTNQAGIEKKKTKEKDIQEKISAIMKRLGFPIQVFICTGENIYRKPCTAVWDFMVKECNGGLAVDENASYYVGDAAGRPKAWAPGHKKDFSCSDRKFAANIGVAFHTPEEYFDGARPYTKFEWRSINPKTVIQETNNEEYEMVASKETEMVVLVGFPASGKSTFAKKYLQSKDYAVINRDTLKTQEKCLKEANEKLNKNISVVIDNTNPSKESRKQFIDIAKKNSIRVRCFQMDTTFEMANHLNMYRQSQTNGKTRRIPGVGFNVFKSRFEKPEKSEGFTEIRKIPFIPKFEEDTEKDLFMKWTG